MRKSHHPTLDATHLQAKREAEAAGTGEPILVTADEQTHALHRDGSHWHAPRGGVWLTLLWPTHLEAEAATSAALFASYAALRSCRRAVNLAPAGCACSLEIKWPNDLLLDEKKVGSSLVEVIEAPFGDAPRAMVVSVGINANIPLAALYQAADALPNTTLAYAAGGEMDATELAQATATDLMQLLQSAECNGVARGIIKAIESRLAWLGDPVSVMLDDERVEGILRGLNEEGCLELDTMTGIRCIDAGDVERLRPLDHLETWYRLGSQMPMSDAWGE